MANNTFNLSRGEEVWVHARPEEPKHLSVVGDALVDRKDIDGLLNETIAAPVTVTGPARVVISDAPPQKQETIGTVKPKPKKSKAKSKGKK